MPFSAMIEIPIQRSGNQKGIYGGKQDGRFWHKRNEGNAKNSAGQI
jgi:hypothetical protein